jgi:hypothetical protein
MDGWPVKCLPEWFPGAKFQTEAKEWSKLVLGMPRLPYEFVKRSMVCCYVNEFTGGQRLTRRQADGTAPSSICSRRLGELQGKDNAEFEEVLRSTMGAMYAGGSRSSFLQYRL